MVNLKAVKAALAKKQADLDMMDDQIMGMPEMSTDAPESTSPEFDLLTEKREELEEEIRHMREGVELISQWDKFKDGPWSEEIKNLLNEIDAEISDIAGGDVASPDAGMEMNAAPPLPAPDMATPPMENTPPPPPASAPPASPESSEIPPAEPDYMAGGTGVKKAGITKTCPQKGSPEWHQLQIAIKTLKMPDPIVGVLGEPSKESALKTLARYGLRWDDAEPALEPPLASVKAGNTQAGKKNSYQDPSKKGAIRSDINKEGSNMATPTTAKVSVQEKLAAVKTKRESIHREAQQRVAAAWTIAKTMLPTAPAEVQKVAAANLLKNPTNLLNAMLRQTAKNAHYSKLAEKFEAVHKKTLNDHLEDPSVLASLKSEVEKELKGDPKSAARKKADDRKDAGPQTSTYNDGRGCGGGKHTEPKQMDAGSTASETEAQNRPEHTVNKSEGDGKVAKAKKACDKDCKGCDKCENKTASDCSDYKCGSDACKKCTEKKEKEKKKAKAKTADPVTDAPPAAPAPPASMDNPPAEEMESETPEDIPPVDMPEEDMDAEADTAGEVLSDEKKMIVEEKIEEAQDAIKALEQEILSEGEEEINFSSEEESLDLPEEGEGENLDYSQIFNEEDMEEKVSALANEHTAGNGEEYFSPSSAESMEASFDESQIASMEDFFSLRGSDSDPLAHLIAGDIRTAADVAGFKVVESMTGEAAKHFESDSATGETRDNENDHEGDLFAEVIEDQKPEDGGFKRVKQDETNVLQAPKSAGKKEAVPVIKKLKNVTAASQKPIDIASALLGEYF